MANSDDEIRLRNQPLGYLQEADKVGRAAWNAIEHGTEKDRQNAPALAELAHAYANMAVASAILHRTVSRA